MALSKTQTKRLGAILNIMFGDSVPSDVLTDLITKGYIEIKGQEYNLTAIDRDWETRY